MKIPSTAFLCFFSLACLLSPARASENSDLLRKLVEIPSGSAQVEGVERVQKIVSQELEVLGFKIERVADASHHAADLLIATKPGLGPQYITLVMHADTVFDLAPDQAGVKMSGDQKTAMGPGITDDKGGIVVALGGLKRFFAKNNGSTYGLRVVCSPNEEVGSTGFAPLFQDIAKNSFLIMGFEGALEDGSLVSSRRGNRWYDIKAAGREAHPGREHKVGANACVELSRKLDRLSGFTDYEKDVTVSVGHMSGGKDKYNIICGAAEAKVDTRFSTLQDGNLLHERILKVLGQTTVRAASDGFGVKTSFDIADYSPPFAVTDESRKYLARYLQALKEVEKKSYTYMPSGGTADTNLFGIPGAVILDGLGPIGGKMHTADEFIDLSSLETRSEAFVVFLKSIQ